MRLSVGSKVSSKLGGKVGKEDEAPPPPPPRLSVGSSHLFVEHTFSREHINTYSRGCQ